MATLTAIATHDALTYRRMGIRRAVLSRHANLGDCWTSRDVLQRLLSGRFARRSSSAYPIGRGPSAAQLAVAVSRRVLQDLPGLTADEVGSVIYCHTAIDQTLSDSTAGRLQFDLGLPRANPFSISQSHNAGLLVGLDIALGLVDGPEANANVLLVASDKLLYGGPSDDSRALMFGDVAAAAMVSREARPGWQVDDVRVRQFDTPCSAYAAWPAGDVKAFAEFGAEVVGAALRDTGLAPLDLAAVVTTTPDAALVAALHRAARLGRPRAPAREARASSPDLLIALASLQASVARNAPVLAWSAGNNGEFACGVLTKV